MEEYRRNLSDFEARFATGQACRDDLFLLRWPEGFGCPSCGFDGFWPVRSVWMQCRRCADQGAVSHEPLEFYLDEFTFRFNRRRSKNRGKLFYRMVQQAVVIDPVPYKSMILCDKNGANRNHNL